MKAYIVIDTRTNESFTYGISSYDCEDCGSGIYYVPYEGDSVAIFTDEYYAKNLFTRDTHAMDWEKKRMEEARNNMKVVEKEIDWSKI